MSGEALIAGEDADQEPTEVARIVVTLDFSDYIAMEDHIAYMYDAAMTAVLVNVDEIGPVDGVKVEKPETEPETDEETDEETAHPAALVISGNGEYELDGVTYAVTGLVLPVAVIEGTGADAEVDGDKSITISSADGEATLPDAAPIFRETDDGYADIFALFTDMQEDIEEGDGQKTARLTDWLFGVAYAEEVQTRALQMKLFDIGLRDSDGEAVEPGSTVHVETSFEGISGEDFRLYHIVDGAPILVRDAVVVEDGQAVGFDFEIDSLSPFALVYYTVTTETGEVYTGYSYKTEEKSLNAQSLLEALGIQAIASAVTCDDGNVVIDGLSIALPEAFTRATVTVVAGLDHYEITLLAGDALEATAGEYTVALDLSRAGLNENGVYKVTIDQAPATEEQVAAVEAALSETLESGVKKVAKVSDLEMVDISILDIADPENPVAVEPEGEVAVTLTRGGETLPTVVHFLKDGGVEKLEVVDGKFVTSSFSEFTGSYTVDFHYEGVDYSIPGNSQILLSELISLLGIRNDAGELIQAADVEAVTFTGRNLVSVEKVSGLITYNGRENVEVGDKDFLLTSLAPFKTDEALFIAMASGEIVTIGVTDDVVESENLKDFLKNLTVTGASIVNGNYAVEEGKDYSIHLTFGENVYTQFKNDGTLTYQLPSGVTVPRETDTELIIAIADNGATINASGHVHVDTDGKVTVTFDQRDPNYNKLVQTTNVNFDIDIDVRFTKRIESTEWSEKIIKDVIIKDPEPGDVFARKTATYDEQTGTFYYTITLNATGDVTNVKVKDTFASDVLDFNSDVWHTDRHTWTKDETVTNGFGYTIDAMIEGEEVKITYSATLNRDKIKDLTKVTADMTKNTVTVEKEGGTPHNAEYSREIQLRKFDKSNGTASDTQDVEGKTIYDWTIEYNSNPLVPVGGDIITDRIADASRAYMNYYGTGITVKVYNADGSQKERYQVPYGDLANYTAESHTWSYTIPDTDTAYRYVITYQTIVDKGAVQQSGTDQTINNTANVGGQTDWGSITVPAGEKPTITKVVKGEGTTDDGEQWVEWESVIHVPSTGLSEAVVTDTFPAIARPHIGGNNWESVVYDTYMDGSLSITGTVPGESWKIQSTQDKLVITFYKDADKTTEGLIGVEPDGHYITVRLKTKVDSDWLSYNYAHPTDNNSKDHKNIIDINKKLYAEAMIQFVPKTIEKTGSKLSNYNINGTIAPVFEYMIMVGGVSEDGLTVQDTFDKRILKVADPQIMRVTYGKPAMQIVGFNYHGWNQQEAIAGIDYRDTPNGIEFYTEQLPRDSANNLFNYYKITYYLQLREGLDLDELAIMNGGKFEIDNTATWGGHTTTYTYEHEYDFLTKEILQEASASNRKVQYKITYNEAKARLNGGDPVEMVDVLNKYLSLDYSSIHIETDPTGRVVTYNIQGSGPDTAATYTIPDETKVIITYDATVVSSGSNGGTIRYENIVTVNGKTERVYRDVQIAATAGGSGAIAHVKAVKVDGNVGSKKLAGAKFKLYASDLRELNNEGDKEIKLTSDENGLIDIDGDKIKLFFAATAEDSIKYYLEEIEAPDDYLILDHPYEFTLVNNADNVDYEKYVYYFQDSFQVKNWPLSGLVVEKQVAPRTGQQLTQEDLNKEFEFEVYILKEDGTVNTEYNEKNGDDQFVNGKVSFKLKHNQQKSFWGFVSGTKYKVVEKDPDGYTVRVTYTGVTSVDSETGEVTTQTGTEDSSEHTDMTYGKYSKVKFTNTASDNEPVPISATKAMKGGEAPENGKYSFTLTALDGAPLPEGATEAEKAAAEMTRVNADGTVSFGNIVYTVSDMADAPVEGSTTQRKKTFTYTVTEVDESATNPLITYDPAVYTVSVMLIYDTGDGSLSLATGYPMYTKTVGGETSTAEAIAFENEETTTVTVEKEWKNSNGNQPPEGATISLDLLKSVASEAETGAGSTPAKVSTIILNGKADVETVSTDEQEAAGQETFEASGNAQNHYEYEPWKAKWTELPKYQNGKLITYMVRETGTWNGYKVSYGEDGAAVYASTGGKITNTEDEITLNGTKTWVDDVAYGVVGATRPDTLTIRLFTVEQAENETEKETELALQSTDANANYYLSWDKTTAPDIWTYTISHLPKTDAAGQEIVYRVKEVVPDNYRAENGGVANMHDDAETANSIEMEGLINIQLTGLTVEKKWEFNGSPAQEKDIDVDKIYFHLYRKNGEIREINASGKAVDTAIEDTDTENLWKVEKGDGSWTAAVNGLDKYYVATKLTGEPGNETEVDVVKPYKYHIVEVIPAGWSVKSILTAENAVVDSENGVDGGTIYITNSKYSVSLPATGGLGTSLFYALGSILTLLATVLLITKKRSEGEEAE